MTHTMRPPQDYRYQRYDGQTARVARWSSEYIDTLRRHRYNISVYKTPINRHTTHTRVH